jgi:hypothetical protein
MRYDAETLDAALGGVDVVEAKETRRPEMKRPEMNIARRVSLLKS